MRIVGGIVMVLWTLAGVAAVWRGDDDALAAASLCAVVGIVVAFLVGRRSVGLVARAKARAVARADARAAARAHSDASAHVLVVNQVGDRAVDVPLPWQGETATRAEHVALEALRADELDAGDEYAEVVERVDSRDDADAVLP